MGSSWQTVYTTDKLYQAEIIKDVLQDNDIESVIFNQQDSAYLFGEIEIKVMPDDVIRAKFLIKDI